jgi:two-component system sensor histidine kinase HydH
MPDDGPQKKKADRVVREAMRLEKLTDDLLDLVRTSAVRRRRVDPREPVDAAIEAVASAQIEKNYADGLSDHELDPDRLGLALENVLRNAVQASGAAPVEVSLTEEQGALVIAVRDHGPGIPSGEEHAIFKPFRTGKARGTGLGLAIAQRIVELHGGRIEASNHRIEGAVFRITIPMTTRGSRRARVS